MKKVLLSTDFSENAQHAIDYALVLFGKEEVSYYLMNAYCLMHNIPETLISLEDILQEQSEKGLKNNLGQILDRYHEIKIDTISAYGDPSVTIKKTVKDRAIDLVVLGSRGSKSLTGAVFGSTTSDLVNRIAQPMLIVPPHSNKDVPSKIVLATDLVQIDDLKTLELMLMLARKHGTEIVIMNVTGNAQHYEIHKALQRLEFNNHFDGINYRFEVVYNKDVLSGIGEFVSQEKADLLVLSPKHYPIFKGMFHLSVTKRMINRSEIPILVI